MTDPVTRTASPVVPPSWVSSPKPAAARARPAAITATGGARRASSGTAMEPRMSAAEAGNDHRPACNGDSPSTSCRYWAINSKAPNPTKKLSRLVARAALKARLANSRMSISGSASLRCRRTNPAPASSPARMHPTGGQPGPFWASCLSP
jgi:hypothetical protein